MSIFLCKNYKKWKVTFFFSSVSHKDFLSISVLRASKKEKDSGVNYFRKVPHTL